MTRFALTKTTPLLLGMLALAACPGDTTPIDTEGTTGEDGDTTMTPTTLPMTTTIDPDDSGSSSSESGDTGTTAADPCADVDCPEGEECIAGNCFMCGQPACEPACADGEACQCPADDLCCDMGSCGAPVCPLPPVDGNMADCIDDMNMTSNAPCDGAPCVADANPPTAAVCLPQGCEAACQCPPPPDTGDAVVTCDDVTQDMVGDCYLDCQGGATCPDGMVCFGGFICLFSNAAPVEVPTYGDCFNVPGATCADGFCVQAPDAGVCVIPCADAAECPPAPATGDAVVTCSNITQPDMEPECWLDCQGGATCPDGMVCYGGFACLWPEIIPMGDAYGDCINDPAACQAGEDTCFDDGAMPPGAGACSQSGCADAMECPAAPATGDAVVACNDFGDGNTCYLDCSMGETCPDGMACTDVGMGMGMGSACMWPFVPPDFTCADSDLGSAVGAAVAMGTTVGAGDDFTPSCSAGNDEDVELQWTAPADATYTFDTTGSDFDTILSVYTHCTGMELACDDDISMMMLQSEVTVDLLAGQAVLIVIDGFNETGNYELNIN